MNIVKINDSHIDMLKEIIKKQSSYESFCSIYTLNLNNFHAYASIKDNKITGIISYYTSDEDASWYLTNIYGTGIRNHLKLLLDRVININESNGRLKFYSLIPSKNTKHIRKFCWSKYNNQRYDYVDECIVPDKTKTFYTNYWEILFKRTLVEYDTVVRCNFLKQEHRNTVPLGGNL